MKTSKNVRVGFLAAGLVALALAVWLWPAPTLSASDVQAAFGSTKRVSLDGMRSGQSRDIDVTVPDTPVWARIRKAWGDPGYLIAAVANGRNYLYCFDKTALKATATVGQEVLSLESADRALYGYSAECSSVGLSFRAAPGALVRVQISSEINVDSQMTALIVTPYWTSDVKDRLVGHDLALQLRPPVILMALLGVFLAVYSLFPVTRTSVSITPHR